MEPVQASVSRVRATMGCDGGAGCWRVSCAVAVFAEGGHGEQEEEGVQYSDYRDFDCAGTEYRELDEAHGERVEVVDVELV